MSFNFANLSAFDPEVMQTINNELKRQQDGIDNCEDRGAGAERQRERQDRCCRTGR